KTAAAITGRKNRDVAPTSFHGAPVTGSVMFRSPSIGQPGREKPCKIFGGLDSGQRLTAVDDQGGNAGYTPRAGTLLVPPCLCCEFVGLQRRTHRVAGKTDLCS